MFGALIKFQTQLKSGLKGDDVFHHAKKVMSKTKFVASASLIAMTITSCGTPSGTSQRTQRPSPSDRAGVEVLPPVDLSKRITVPHMAGREPVRVGLLLPLTNSQSNIQSVGEAMLNAAQLALFEIGNDNVLLIPKDTYGTATGAQKAAEEAIEEGAEILLGPLFAGSVRTAGNVAHERGVPMIAFSTDRTVAGNGVYLLSFLPEQEVKRVTEFALSEGYFAFAALVPMSAYGDRVRSAFQTTVTRRGGRITQMQPYPRNAEQMFAPARIVAEYDRRKSGRRSSNPSSGSGGNQVFDPDTGEVLNKDNAVPYSGFANETWGGVSYQAVLLPEGGTMLRSLAPLLPYFDVDPRQIKFMGTGLWDDATLGKEPSLVGGWYAAPEPKMRGAYDKRYADAFGSPAPRISSLAFDAVALVSSLSRLPEGQRYSFETIGNANGFAGIDGIFRFLSDGSAERGLAVVQVLPDGLEVISPAPTTFQSLDMMPQFEPQSSTDTTTDVEGIGY